MDAAQSSEEVSARWVDGQVFVLQDRHGFPVMMSQPDGANGADLLPMSLIGCAAWDVVAILRKQRQSVSGLEVSAQSFREPEPPWRFQRIHIHYKLRGKNLDRGRISRAIDLAQHRYCSIYATLEQVVDIQSDFEVDDGATGPPEAPLSAGGPRV
jgi:putative redox protein